MYYDMTRGTHGVKKEMYDIKKIIKDYLKYKKENQKMLKIEAKERDITIPNGMKKDEIILLLMTTPDSRLKLE